MNSFIDGLLVGVFAVLGFAAIALPIALASISPWWVFLYLVDIPLVMGCVGYIEGW